MEAQNGGSLAQKPQFFKVLLPNPSANLMIPHEFHTNLPRELPKMATLFSPISGKFWHVEIRRSGREIYFEKGWSEFAMAHDLHNGYFLVFRYVGNMIFKVKIFDTTGCRKNFRKNFRSFTCHTRRYKIKELSETVDQTLSNSSQEHTEPLEKRRKLDREKAREVAKRKEKKNKETDVNSTICSSQFEMILKPYCFSQDFLNIPRKFCVQIGLLGKQIIFLKWNSSEGKSWPVRFNPQARLGSLGKGWKQFREGARLKEGDLCIFRLISKNPIVVIVDVVKMPQESDATGKKEGTVNEGSSSSVMVLEGSETEKMKKKMKRKCY